MPSFFEKLKKGMGIEEPLVEDLEEEREEEIVKKPRKPRVKRTSLLKQTRPVVLQARKLEIKAVPKIEDEELEMKIEKEPEPPEITEMPAPAQTEKSEEPKEKWPTLTGQAEGQLAIDVYQTENDLVIQSAIAGVRPESLDIALEKDIITIKGARKKPFQEEGDYFAQECYWGLFSREVILPVEADPNQAVAKMKDGILTIRIPKILREKKRRIAVTG